MNGFENNFCLLFLLINAVILVNGYARNGDALVLTNEDFYDAVDEYDYLLVAFCKHFIALIVLSSLSIYFKVNKTVVLLQISLFKPHQISNRIILILN